MCKHGDEQSATQHDPLELLEVNAPVPVHIGIVQHLLDLLLRHSLPVLLQLPLELDDRDRPVPVLVELPKCLVELLLRISLF